LGDWSWLFVSIVHGTTLRLTGGKVSLQNDRVFVELDPDRGGFGGRLLGADVFGAVACRA
jgi:hypothetical protein